MNKSTLIKFNLLFLLFSCTSSFATKPKAALNEQPIEFSSLSFVPSSKESEIVVSTFQFVIDGTPNLSNLYLYNSTTNKLTKLKLPAEMEGRTLLGLFPKKSSKEIYVFSQLQKAGTDKPQVDLINLQTQKWTSVQSDINCVNIEKFEVNSKSQLSLKCGEDYINPPVKSSIQIKLLDALNPVLNHKKTTLLKSSNNQDVEVINNETKAAKKVSLRKIILKN